jgi:hypothetical protein
MQLAGHLVVSMLTLIATCLNQGSIWCQPPAELMNQTSKIDPSE